MRAAAHHTRADAALTHAARAGEWGPTAAAKRICAELGLPQSSEQLVHDQIRNGLRRYDEWSDRSRGRERLLELTLDLTLGGLRYRDRLLWDANQPQNASGPEDFAACTCADLGLRCGCALLHS